MISLIKEYSFGDYDDDEGQFIILLIEKRKF